MRLILALWLAVAPACAQEPIIGSGVYASKSTATYSGPGDVVSGAIEWVGLRAYTAAIAAAGTQKIVNVRNTGSSETCDVLVASNGGLATTVSNCSGASSGTALSTFCGGCAITKLYDQTLNSGDVAQGTAANQPTFNNSGALPFLSNSSSTLLTNNSLVAGSNQPWTLSAVGERTNTAQSWFAARSSSWAAGFGSGANLAGLFAGSAVVTASASDNALHAFQYIANGASSVINVDNTNSTVSPGGNALGTPFAVGNDQLNGGGMTGEIMEVGVWSGSFSTTQRTNMCHNQFTYWGTSTSC